MLSGDGQQKGGGEPGVSFLARSNRDTGSMPAWLTGGIRQRRNGLVDAVGTRLRSAALQTIENAADSEIGPSTAGPHRFPAFAAHLRRLAAGELPPIPSGLTKELHELLDEIHQAIRA